MYICVYTIVADIFRKIDVHDIEIFLIEWVVSKAAKLEFLEGLWGEGVVPNQNSSVGGGYGFYGTTL